MRNLIPDFKLCIKLKEQGYPQANHAHYWRFTGVFDGKGESVMQLFPSLPGNDDWKMYYAAPTAEEFQSRMPTRFFTMFSQGVWILIDASGTTMKTEKQKDSVGNAITFQKIGAADAKKASECWAKGILFLLENKALKLTQE